MGIFRRIGVTKGVQGAPVVFYEHYCNLLTMRQLVCKGQKSESHSICKYRRGDLSVTDKVVVGKLWVYYRMPSNSQLVEA